MSWSAEQQRMLSAMGYVLYARAGSTDVSPAPTARVAEAAKPSVAAVGAKFAAVTAIKPDSAVSHDRLLQALQRAAGNGDISALITDLAALRRDPLRKRALWPKLRALRRPH